MFLSDLEGIFIYTPSGSSSVAGDPVAVDITVSGVYDVMVVTSANNDLFVDITSLG